MRSKIKHITGNGSFSGKNGITYVFEVTMEDGYTGQINHTKYSTVDELPYKIGDEKDYKREEYKGYPKIKWIEAAPSNTSYSTSKNDDTQLQIVRQSSIKAALDTVANGIKTANSVHDVLEIAEVYTNYVINGK